jgi:hypothetical protein
MPNPYITQVPSYMQQDQQGLMPVFQNVAAQQANMNQQLAQSNQLSQPTTQGSGYSGLNPLAMATMLRKKDPNKSAPVYDYSQNMPDAPQYLDPAYMQAGY